MLLALGLVSIAVLIPASCPCGDALSGESLASTSPCERDIEATHPWAKRRLFVRSGWKQRFAYGAVDGLPPMHISVAELGPGTTGWISRRGRRGQWQLDAWQVTSFSPLDLNPAAHVHLIYRIPLRRRRQQPSTPRPPNRP